MTTIKEIAQESGYSPATVSRLLNNDPNLSITANTKNKILETANKLGYWKNHQSRRIHPTIALLYRVNDPEQLQDEYFTSLKNKITEVVKKEDLEIKIYHSIHGLIKDAALFQGFVGVGTNRVESKKLEDLHKVLPNGVFIDTNPAPKLFDAIKPNLALTVEDAIEQLVNSGYKKIGFIGGDGAKFNGIQERDVREITFDEYVNTHHIPNTKTFVGGPFSVDNGYVLGKKVIQECNGDLPDAFVIASDTLSVGVLQAFNEAKISIPGDVAILSINNSNVANYVSPPLSSYSINQDEMVNMALRMLTDLIVDADRPHIQTDMNTKLIIRKSFIPRKK